MTSHRWLAGLAVGAALLQASAALASGSYPVLRWVIEGDTQDYALAAPSLPSPNLWDETHGALCALAAAKNLQGVIGTGDIVDTHGWFNLAHSPEAAAADHAYDILDACRLVSVLPAGNHDFYGAFPGELPPPNHSDQYLRFVYARPFAPTAPRRSPTGLSWIQPLGGSFHLLVLPYEADAAEEAWAEQRILTALPGVRFFLLQHEAVDPAQRPQLVASTAAARLAAQFGPQRVPLVIGGHYKPVDKVETFVTPSGTRALFVNFQSFDPLNGNQPYWGYLVWLEFDVASGRWCFWDENLLTGERNRFQATTCWTP